MPLHFIALVRNCNKVFLVFGSFDCSKCDDWFMLEKVVFALLVFCSNESCDVAHLVYRENLSFLLSRRENDVENESQAFCVNKVSSGSRRTVRAARSSPPIRQIAAKLGTRTGHGAPAHADPPRLAILGDYAVERTTTPARSSAQSRPQCGGSMLPVLLGQVL